MTRKDLTQMSHDELIELVLAMHAQLEALRAENEALKLKLEKGKKPPTNSENSSQPPSRDQKANLAKDRNKRRRGPPRGHAKYERGLVEHPDHVIEVRPQECASCRVDLGQETGRLIDLHQITELPEARSEVIEVRQYAVACPCCGREQRVDPPVGLEQQRRFGARLEATVVYYRQEQHMSYVRTVAALRDLHGVHISQGGIDKIMQRVGRQALQAVDAIRQDLRDSPVIHSDETGSRVDGQNWWQWVFCSASAVLHVIRFNRSADVIQMVMGEQTAEVWVSDCYLPQMKAPAQQRHVCLAHQLRNLQAVVERYPASFWPRAMQALFRAAIHLHNHADGLAPPHLHRQIQRLETLCDWLLERTVEQPEARLLLKRYRKYREHLFVFLYRSDVSPTNNLSERKLRPSVVHRKVIGCFRSEWGTQAYAALASVIDTAALKGVSSFQAVQSLFGRPALPIPTPA